MLYLPHGRAISLRRALSGLVFAVFALESSRAQSPLARPSPSQPLDAFTSIGEDRVVLCQGVGLACLNVDPCCEKCGLGRCLNVDDSCLGEGLLKVGRSCQLLWAEVPAGVEVTFYNLWGPWSASSDDCAQHWSCYFWAWPFHWACLRGSQPKETWIGPTSAPLADARCAVKISVRPGYTCGYCEPGFYRSNRTGPATCEPCTATPCPPGWYRGPCGHSSDSQCLECPVGTYKTMAGNDAKLCRPCPENTFSNLPARGDLSACTPCAGISKCQNLSYSPEGSSDFSACTCPLDPLLTAAAMALGCLVAACMVVVRAATPRGHHDELCQQLLASSQDPPPPGLETIAAQPDAAAPKESPRASSQEGARGPEEWAMAEKGGAGVPAAASAQTRNECVNECVVCLSAAAVMAMLDCGHLCACEKCAPDLSMCPICRGRITEIKRIWAP